MNLLEQAGARPQRQPEYVPLFIDKTFTGLFTQRAALHDPSDLATARFYGGRPDALWMGQNVELTNRLTLQRRPGLVPFSLATYPTPPDRVFSFQLTNGAVQVLVDTTPTGALDVTSVADSSGSTAVYTGVFPDGGSNAYVGMSFPISGFIIPSNNGVFVCTASTITTITLENASAVAETISASAISSGAVYVDNQDGTTTLLFGKSPGAGQTHFVAVAGVLYMGDGVDVRKYTPLNTNGTIWEWGTAAPGQPPTVVVTESGAASGAWAASVFFSTMGIIVDSNGNAEQLISVNANGTNPSSRIGTSANGNPFYGTALVPGATVTDGTVTWQNRGQVVSWAANTGFGNIGNAYTGGGVNIPSSIFVPAAGTVFVSSKFDGVLGITGSIQPTFTSVPGQVVDEGTHPPGGDQQWTGLGGQNLNWSTSTVYSSTAGPIIPFSFVVAPFSEPTATGQKTYAFVCISGGTSGGGYPPPWSTTVGGLTQDGQLQWVNLGSATWAASTPYTAWTSSTNHNFSAIVDSNDNIQICIKTGNSGSPFEPIWQTTYGSITHDFGVDWVCVGSSLQSVWSAAQKYYLPPQGFFVPSASDSFGGASIIDTNGDVEFVVNSGLSASVHPSWNGIGSYTAEDLSGTVFALTQVAVSIGNATYTGTITGGDANAFAGQTFLIAGFSTVGNNVLISVTASSATTLVCVATSQVDETHVGTATDGLIWFNESAQSVNSLSWQFGHVYAYSYKARSLTDFYSVPGVNGQIPIPPGANPNIPLPTPTGSETNLISTASPVFTITGPNPGAVNSVYGQYSSDPQIDTIVIWRDADGGGADNMFELTEIPNIPALAGSGIYTVNGVKYDWVFQDYLPDTPTTDFPGLNTGIPAPIDDSNDPPPSAFLPMAYNFTRIWGADGQNVLFSGGPDVITGNPNEAFDPVDDIPFLATVTRIVRNSQGLVVFLIDSIEVILGGPSTDSFFSVTLAPGIGLLSFNALDVFAGEIFFFASDNSFRVINPSLNLSNAGFPLGDQFANLPSSGVSDTTWDASKVYVAVHTSGTDNCIMVADGSTGWYRCNPNQVPGGAGGPEPIWSPFAAITNGCQMVQSIEVSPGVKQLLVGPTTNNAQILERSLSVFKDNGTSYDAYFTMGSITLAHPGQLAILKFLEMDFSKFPDQTTVPTVSYLLNEIAGTFTPFVQSQQDPPSIYGATGEAASYNPSRYYFSSNAQLARAKHLQIKVDFGGTPSTPNPGFTIVETESVLVSEPVSSIILNLTQPIEQGDVVFFQAAWGAGVGGSFFFSAGIYDTATGDLSEGGITYRGGSVTFLYAGSPGGLTIEVDFSGDTSPSSIVAFLVRGLGGSYDGGGGVFNPIGDGSNPLGPLPTGGDFCVSFGAALSGLGAPADGFMQVANTGVAGVAYKILADLPDQSYNFSTWTNGWSLAWIPGSSPPPPPPPVFGDELYDMTIFGRLFVET